MRPLAFSAPLPGTNFRPRDCDRLVQGCPFAWPVWEMPGSQLPSVDGASLPGQGGAQSSPLPGQGTPPSPGRSRLPRAGLGLLETVVAGGLSPCGDRSSSPHPTPLWLHGGGAQSLLGCAGQAPGDSPSLPRGNCQ